MLGITAVIILDTILLVLYALRFRYESQKSISVKKRVSNSQQKFSNEYLKSFNNQEPITFDIIDLEYDLTLSLFNPVAKKIIRNISGHIRGGKMTAITGPSGSGKTTFLNLLSMKLKPTRGGVVSSAADISSSVAFVPQNDVMYEELTVRENIMHSARIRLNHKEWDFGRISKFVDLIIDILQLGSCQDTVVGDVINRGISGGERKRVNIGMELSACPQCLFLDEPTSGLDSTSALIVVEILKKLSLSGMTVVCVIHQPRHEIFSLFDDICMLATGGHCVYIGDRTKAHDYFADLGYQIPKGWNEADVYMDILCGVGKQNHSSALHLDDLAAKWKDKQMIIRNSADIKSDVGFAPAVIKVHHGEGTQSEVHVMSRIRDNLKSIFIRKQRGGATFITQTILTHNLNILQQYRKFPNLLFEAFVGGGAGSLMGISIMNVGELYKGILKAPYTPVSSAPAIFPTIQFMFVMGASVALAAAPPGVAVFSEEMPVYWRYASSGHNRLAYFIGKSVSTIYRIVFASLHFSAILHIISRPIASFSLTFTVIFLMFFGVYGVCCSVSMIVRRENATLLAVVLALFSAIFCGYGITISDAKKWNLYWLWSLQFNMWASEAYYSETVTLYDHVYDNSFTNLYFGFTVNRVGLDFAMMVLIGITWRAIAFILMISFNRDKQR